MNTYFVSDTHYGHTNVIKYSKRPFGSVEEMNETLIENHNKIVKPGDEVYHLGDFAFLSDDKTIDIIKRLNGNIHFIFGNHDRNIMKSPSKFIGSKLFQSISHYKEINRNDTKIVLFHYGMRTWNKAHYGAFMLHGHSHGSLLPFGRSVDIGVDSKFITEEYRPVSLDEVTVFMSKQKFETVDHHVED
jgi:calcineurin-like phosphoesterase family protein